MPTGYKKVQEVVITDGHVADPSLPEPERLAKEIVDGILGNQFGFHILTRDTVKLPVTKVVVDQNAPFRQPKQKAPLMIRSSITAAAKRSNGSMSSIRDSSDRLNNIIETASLPLSPSKRIVFSSPQQLKSKKRRAMVRPELQLAVA